MNPAAIDNPANGTPPHEIGHALGLDDVNDRKNVMHERAPAGKELTKIQCKTIWNNIDSYPCV
jgi:predicted Zn-dependent protease